VEGNARAKEKMTGEKGKERERERKIYTQALMGGGRGGGGGGEENRRRNRKARWDEIIHKETAMQRKAGIIKRKKNNKG
jgi:hypothetical protein